MEACFQAEYRVGRRLFHLLQEEQGGQTTPGGALGRLGEASVAQVEEMVSRPLDGGEQEGAELFLPERVEGEVRAREGPGQGQGGVERKFARLTTTKGSV